MIKKSLLVLCVIVLSSNKAHSGLQNCGIDKQSQQLAKIIIGSKKQKRKELNCNNKLAQAANKKARAMAGADTISHNINHTTPNEHLENNGIELPYEYSILGNQVEAVSGGKKTAQEAFEYFISSADHRQHLLGENQFYQAQNQIGVGYHYDQEKKHQHYWVVYIASLRENNETFGEKIKIKKPRFKRLKKKKTFKKGDTMTRKEFKY